MPLTAQALYFHLGMHADDDGYCEYFGVVRMSGANTDDLKILAVKNFVEVFDDLVLIILDWKENNYIPKDRYTPSKYIDVYIADTQCIQDGYKTYPQDRIGKDRIGKVNIDSIVKTSIKKFKPNNYEETKLVEISQALGEENLSYLLGKYKQGHYWAIEKAWGVFSEIDSNKLQNKGAYFNSLVENAIGENK